jgi:hypothetical protein
MPVPDLLGKADPPLVGVDVTIGSGEHAILQVRLTKDLDKFIAHKVQTGGYTNASKVVRDASRNFSAKVDPAERRA